MKNPLLLAVVPALLIGLLNGYLLEKKGYNRCQYTFYGFLVSYIFLVKSIAYFLEL
jgi:hypothetical protein